MASDRLTAKQAAARLGLTANYLSILRHYGTGPAFQKDAKTGAISYARADVDAWQVKRAGAGDLAPEAAAARAGATVGLLGVLRHRGAGPEFRRQGGRVFYTRAAVDAWVAERKAKKRAATAARRTAARDPRKRRKTIAEVFDAGQ